MHIILILLVIAGGMGLSVEAGLLGPLGSEVGDLWAAFSIFSVGTGLTFLLMLFSAPQQSLIFAQPSWHLLGGVLGPVYVIILTIATPAIGIAMTMIGILAGRFQKPDYRPLWPAGYAAPQDRYKTHYCAGIYHRRAHSRGAGVTL